jgi:hypothetical protein
LVMGSKGAEESDRERGEALGQGGLTNLWPFVRFAACEVREGRKFPVVQTFMILWL